MLAKGRKNPRTLKVVRNGPGSGRFLPLSFGGAAVFFMLVLSAAPQSPPPVPSESRSTANVAAPQAPISAQDNDPEVALEKEIAAAANDQAALVRNLKNYIRRFPDSPRKADVYRALVKTCQEIRDDACTLDYAERLIDFQPMIDSETLMLAATLLQQQADDASLARAVGYVGRVLERFQNSTLREKPDRMSAADWQNHRQSLLMALYSLRGDLEKSNHDYEAATKDLQTSYSILPNPAAAAGLGEIAELRKDTPTAIQEYTLAFVLPGVDTPEKVDRRKIRMNLGNVWQQAHGSEQGLAEAILGAYDDLAPAHVNSNLEPKNEGAKDAFVFVLRHIDGGPLPLAPLRGKTLVLSFWATWCAPCHELEPIFVQVARAHAADPSIVFLAVNADEDQSLVPPFVAREKWDVPTVYSDGFGKFLGVNALPTVIILDGEGKIIYRVAGFPEQGFAESLNEAIKAAVNQTN